jgi:hypothetical protein
MIPKSCHLEDTPSGKSIPIKPLESVLGDVQKKLIQMSAKHIQKTQSLQRIYIDHKLLI